MVTNSEIENQIESVYPIKIKDIRKVSAGFVINNQYVLKATDLSSERLLFIHSALCHLQENKFTNCESFIVSSEGKPFTQIDGKNCILTPFHQEPGFSFEIAEELSAATELLAKMHLAGRGFTTQKAISAMEKYQLPYTVKITLGDSVEIFQKRCNELKKFKKIASGSVVSFDRAYAQIAPEYCTLAEDLTAELKASSYSEMVKSAQQTGCLCHRDFTGHNTVKCSPLPLIINFDEAAIELPVYDIANLLKRRLRKCNWSIEEAHFILNCYGKIRPISHNELYVLKILLRFPQKLWRITNKYYNSKKSRYEKTALAKLDEILQEREPLLKVIKEL